MQQCLCECDVPDGDGARPAGPCLGCYKGPSVEGGITQQKLHALIIYHGFHF